MSPAWAVGADAGDVAQMQWLWLQQRCRDLTGRFTKAWSSATCRQPGSAWPAFSVSRHCCDSCEASHLSHYTAFLTVRQRCDDLGVGRWTSIECSITAKSQKLALLSCDRIVHIYGVPIATPRILKLCYLTQATLFW